MKKLFNCLALVLVLFLSFGFSPVPEPNEELTTFGQRMLEKGVRVGGRTILNLPKFIDNSYVDPLFAKITLDTEEAGYPGRMYYPGQGGNMYHLFYQTKHGMVHVAYSILTRKPLFINIYYKNIKPEDRLVWVGVFGLSDEQGELIPANTPEGDNVLWFEKDDLRAAWAEKSVIFFYTKNIDDHYKIGSVDFISCNNDEIEILSIEAVKVWIEHPMVEFAENFTPGERQNAIEVLLRRVDLYKRAFYNTMILVKEPKVTVYYDEIDTVRVKVNFLTVIDDKEPKASEIDMILLYNKKDGWRIYQLLMAK